MIGENFTLMTQSCPGVNVTPEQLSVAMGNSVALVEATAVMVRLAVPVFVALKYCGALVVPTFWVGKVRLAGWKAIAGPAETAVPVNVMVWVPGVAVSVSAIVAVSAPLAPVGGINCTAT